MSWSSMLGVVQRSKCGQVAGHGCRQVAGGRRRRWRGVVRGKWPVKAVKSKWDVSSSVWSRVEVSKCLSVQ